MSSKRGHPRISDLIRGAGRPADRDEAPSPEAPEGPGPVEPGPADAPPASRDVETEAEGIRSELLERMTRVFEEAPHGPFDPEGLEERIDRIAPDRALLDGLYAGTFRDRKDEPPLAAKSVRVAIYALRFGRALALDVEPQVRLGLAALLHQIGLARLPSKLVEKPGVLSRRERARLQEHPRLGQTLVLESLGEAGRDIAEIVLQSHERIDGSGYPEGLRGDALRREAQIVGLVDIFEAMIQPRPYRERLVPFAAVKELLEREREHFSKELLREFVATFSVFPPYTFVRLNSNAIAQVLETEAGYPLRPTVAILVDASGRRAEDPAIVRLRETPLLYITGPLRREEVPA